MPQVIQPSFAKGELSPTLHGRVDTAAYQIGLAKAKNAVVHTYGGVGRRRGTRFIGPVADHTYAPRLVEFEFKTTDSYVLEFGDLYLRFIRDDGHVTQSFQGAPTAITQANPGVVTLANHEFVNGMQVTFTNITGMTELNGNTYTVANTTTNTFELSGTDTTAFGAFTFSATGNVAQNRTITAATNANPVVLTVTAHNFSNNDEVFISGVGGMTELNGNRYYIANVTANTFELTDQVDGTNVDGTGFGTFTSGGTAAKIYEIVTPYAIADVDELGFTQSADILTIVHPNYEPRELTRTDHDLWTLTEIPIGPVITSPTGISASINSGSGAVTYQYEVTAIDIDSQEESLTGLNTTTQAITGATQANPVVLTVTAHPFSNGDEIEVNGVVGMTELNGRRFTVANQATNTIELEGEDGTNHTAYSSGGTANWTRVEVTGAGNTPDNTITWTAVVNAERYSVYRIVNGLSNFIGDTNETTFVDNNITAESTLHPPRFRDPWPTSLLNPGAVGYFEQRRVFGGSTSKPDTSEYSQIGNTANFSKSAPLQDDDAITATLNSQQVNQIRHYVPVNDLLIFTSGGEWRINSGPDSLFSANTIKQKPQSNWGSSFQVPIQVGSSVIWVTAAGNQIRALTFSLAEDGYQSANLNLLSAHLLDGKIVVDSTYVRSPESRIYYILNDGTAISLAYEPEQEVIAWTPLDTDGSFERVTTLRGEGTFAEDSTYFLVKRTINGRTVRYIEVMRDTFFDDVRDAFFVDSGLSLDNPVTITGATAANPVVITATAHGFSNGDQVDIRDIIWQSNKDALGFVTQPDQLNNGRFTIANVTANTFELQDEDGNVDGSAFNAYISGGVVRKAITTISGLEHLIGETVSILADGNVVRDLTVSASGTITLPDKSSIVHIGLEYTTDIQTLRIETPEGTIQGRPKVISKVIPRFHKSRGGFWGPNKDSLKEMKQRENENWDEAIGLLTGDLPIHINSDWNLDGQVFFHQRDPLPIDILAIVLDIEVGDI